MKVDLLKKIIKEAVKEAVKEELTELLNSQEVTQEKPTVFSTPKNEVVKDPIMSMLESTRATMTNEDFKNVMNADSSMAQGFPQMMNSISGNPTMRNLPSGPQPGIDISNLDFVKKASSIYNLSVKKDQEKHGI